MAVSPQKPKPAPPGRSADTPSVAKKIANHAITVVATTVAALGVVWMLVGAGSGFQFDFQNGRLTLKVEARDDALGRLVANAYRDDPEEALATLHGRGFYRIENAPLDEVIAHAFDTDPVAAARVLNARGFYAPDDVAVGNISGVNLREMVDALVKNELSATRLNQGGYFRIGDRALIEALRGLDHGDPTALQLRRLLFRLEGPFAYPATLDGAERDFIAQILQGLPLTNTVVAGVWAGFVGQTLNFLYPELTARTVRANIAPEILHHDQNGEAIWIGAACVGSHLLGKHIQIWQAPAGDELLELDSFNVYLRDVLPRPQCSGEPLLLSDIILAGEARVGLPRGLHDRLVESGFPDVADPRIHFVVFPAGVAPVAMLGAERASVTVIDDAG